MIGHFQFAGSIQRMNFEEEVFLNFFPLKFSLKIFFSLYNKLKYITGVFVSYQKLDDKLLLILKHSFVFFFFFVNIRRGPRCSNWPYKVPQWQASLPISNNVFLKSIISYSNGSIWAHSNGSLVKLSVPQFPFYG